MFVMLLMALNHNIREMCSVFVFPASALEKCRRKKESQKERNSEANGGKGETRRENFFNLIRAFLSVFIEKLRVLASLLAVQNAPIQLPFQSAELIRCFAFTNKRAHTHSLKPTLE